MKMRALRSLRVAMKRTPPDPGPTASVMGVGDAGFCEGNVDHATRAHTEIEAMERLGLDELRLQWRNRWGRLPPAHIPRALLFRLMAYRVQAGAFGDLDRQTAAALDRMSNRRADVTASRATAAVGAGADTCPPSSPSPQPSLPSGPAAPRARRPDPPRILKPGAVMTREWRGQIERVMVLEAGFAWNGKTFGSLSSLAFAITGVKWNGHRFFFGARSRDTGDAGGKGGGGRASDGPEQGGPGSRRRLAPSDAVAS